MPEKLRIIFAGSGEFGAPSLQAILRSAHDVVQVVTQPDRPAGRGRTLTPTPIASLATSHKLPLLKTADVNAQDLPLADLMVVIAFGQKIAPHVVDHARLGSINLHASRLPKYRGAAPINWAIIRGETITGNSVIRLAQRMDAGAILAQSQLPIGEIETAGELHDRLAVDGGELVPQVIEQLATGAATETPQDESQATIAPKLSREAARLDFTRPAADLANQIRGMYPWPGCRVRVIDVHGNERGRVILVRARSSASESPASPGAIRPDGFVSCGAGALEVLELQPEAKRPMSLESYRNGHPWEPPLRLESVL